MKESQHMLVYNGRWNFSIYKSLVLDLKLSRDARFLWIALRSFVSENSPAPFPTVKTLCLIMGCGPHALGRYQKELVEQRYLIKQQRITEKGLFTSNLYFLNDNVNNSDPSAQIAHADKPHAGGTQTKSTHTKESPRSKITTTESSPSASSSRASHLVSPSASNGTSDEVPSESEDKFQFRARKIEEYWIKCYKAWWKGTYKANQTDRVRLMEVLKDNEHLGSKEIMAQACLAWLKSDRHLASSGEYDGLFCARRSKRMAYFFKNYERIVLEEIKWGEHNLEKEDYYIEEVLKGGN